MSICKACGQVIKSRLVAGPGQRQLAKDLTTNRKKISSQNKALRGQMKQARNEYKKAKKG